jgi:hypothetical protein
MAGDHRRDIQYLRLHTRLLPAASALELQQRHRSTTEGLDALNFVSDALTVAVFDADTFDDIFRDMVEVNEEGTLARGGKILENFVFDHATVERLLTTEAIAPSGAACLILASTCHNELLGLAT